MAVIHPMLLVPLSHSIVCLSVETYCVASHDAIKSF